MKKITGFLFGITFIITMLLLPGCGGGSSNGFHPPGWIQGQWAAFGAPGITIFEFTSDDVIEYGVGEPVFSIANRFEDSLLKCKAICL